MSSLEIQRTQLANRERPNRQWEVLDLHVVILINYLRPHHVAALKQFSAGVRKLTILLSVPMELDRDWDAQWDGLDVQVQKNFVWKANWRHPAGFSEINFIHFPVDTPVRLKQLKPDIILSHEMGVRTMLSTIYRRFVHSVPLVMVGNMSDYIESERGIVRRLWRRLIRSGVDYFTYNGPSCKRYLQSIGVSESRMFHFPYCIDEEPVFQGKRKTVGDSTGPLKNIKLLYCGAISSRKGVVQFASALANWCENNPHQTVEFVIAGTGELQAEVARQAKENFHVKFLGNCNTGQLREAYRKADVCVFPTLADEWGLVPIEAMRSGIPVLGSIFAQSIEACCVEGENGWVFDPTDTRDMLDAIDRALTTNENELLAMGRMARESVQHISAESSARFLLDAVKKISIVERKIAVENSPSLDGQHLEDSCSGLKTP